MVTGVLKPDNGVIRVGGFDIQKEDMDAKRAFGYIPDQPYLYDRLSPREFLRFIGGLYNMDPEMCDKGIDKWLDRFDLVRFENELIGAFSHGMKQKVAFISALLHDPQVLIIDEPMVGLDPRGAVALKELLRERCSRGLAAFVSTHSLEVAEQISDRIGILYEGKLVAEGSMDELRTLVKHKKERLEEIFLELTQSAGDVGYLLSPS